VVLKFVPREPKILLSKEYLTRLHKFCIDRWTVIFVEHFDANNAILWRMFQNLSRSKLCASSCGTSRLQYPLPLSLYSKAWLLFLCIQFLLAARYDSTRETKTKPSDSKTKTETSWKQELDLQNYINYKAVYKIQFEQLVKSVAKVQILGPPCRKHHMPPLPRRRLRA